MDVKQETLTSNSLFRFLTVVLIPLILLLYIGFGVSSYYETIFILFFINVILTASLNLTNGITGIFSLGQAGFMALGAYISTLLCLPPELKITRIAAIPTWLANIQLPFIAGLLIAATITMLIAGGIGFVILRAKGHYLAVITLGMVIVIKALLDNVTYITNGAKGISGMEKYSTLPVVVIIAVLTLFILYRIKTSAFGRSMIALRDDIDAGASLGINPVRIRLLSFMVSAFFGAVGGVLWAHLERSIAPSLFYFNETFSILEMSVLGGMAVLSGSIPGAAILTFVPHFLANFETGFVIFGLTIPKINGLTNIVMSILFILVIIFRKGGVLKDSDYIVESLFGLKTYTGLFRKETYVNFINSIKNLKRKRGKSL